MVKQDEIKELRKEILMSHGILSSVIVAKTVNLHRNSKPEIHQVEHQTWAPFDKAAKINSFSRVVAIGLQERIQEL